MLAVMANSCDENACNQGSSSELAIEKGSGNKRKFLSECPLDVGVVATPTPGAEFGKCELLEEKLHNAPGDMGSSGVNQAKEEEVKECVMPDWSDPIACQLEELLSDSLHATFGSATKKLTESGYTEEAAERAVLRSGLHYGDKDPVSNTVDGALLYLGKCNGLDTSSGRHHLFADLHSLVQYTILEMVNVLREVKPSLSVAEAMWYLLISDLNLSNACLMDSLCSLLDKEEAKESSSDSTLPQMKVEDQTSETPFVSNPSNPDPKNHPSDIPFEGEFSNFLNVKIPFPGGKMTITGGIQTTSQNTVVEENFGGSRKWISANPKRDILRQKTLHMERYRGRMSKGTFKSKLTSLGSLILDKKQKSVLDSSAAHTKNVSSKERADAPPTSFSVVNDTPATFPVKDTVSAEDSKDSELVSSENKSTTNPQVNVFSSPKTPDYYAGMPFDNFERKYVPQDDKDKMLLALVPKKEALEKELQKWSDWAMTKVMQATRRLGKDKAEMKALKQERDVAEKIRKEKKILEENTMKRLSEMESAIANYTGQIDIANLAISKLELENASLKKELETIKLKTLGSASELEKVVLREQETLKKVQSCDTEKGLLLEKLTTLKQQAAVLRKDLEKTNGLYNQSQALWKQEDKEMVKMLAQASSIRNEREKLEIQADVERAKFRQKADYELQKYKNKIKELEAEISKLKLDAEASKIDALRRRSDWNYGSVLTDSQSTPGLQGYPAPNTHKRLSVFQDISGAGKMKQERECVMCMTEDISVIFLPCAHQVLCEDCNVLHEKQGMKDCPSCRTPIQERFTACFHK